jgi:hypothetical protein
MGKQSVVRLRNCLPRPMRIVLPPPWERSLALPPLAWGELRFNDDKSAEVVRAALIAGVDDGDIEVQGEVAQTNADEVLNLYFWGAIVSGGLSGVFLTESLTRLGIGGKNGGAGIALLGGALVGLLVVALGHLATRGQLAPVLRRFNRATAAFMALLLMLSVVSLVPLGLLAVFAAGGSLANGAEAGLGLLLVGGNPGFVRCTTLVFVWFASAVPGLLYFLYDRKRQPQLREAFEHDVFRLDPRLSNLRDLRGHYEQRLAEAFGPDPNRPVGQGFTGSLWSVILCTALLAGTWTVVLLLPTLGDSADTFSPLASNYTYGFLGAYFFALSLVARRYVRGDLQPRAYAVICSRILMVLILAAVLAATVGHNPPTYVLVFMLGIVPQWFYLVFRDLALPKVRKLFSAMEDRLPLTKLAGIDLYERARLEEEGISNLENFAQADIAELTLTTRFSAAQVVEWIDQTILYLRASGISPPVDIDAIRGDATPEAANGAAEAATSGASNSTRPAGTPEPTLLPLLNAWGVRRATDLACPDGCTLRLEIEELAKEENDPDYLLSRLKALLSLVRSDHLFGNVLHWRQADFRTAATVFVRPPAAAVAQPAQAAVAATRGATNEPTGPAPTAASAAVTAGALPDPSPA